MDPDACLAEIRQIQMLFAMQDGNEEAREPEDIDRYIELVQALDGWMTGGGFPPKAWKKGRD